MKSRTLWVVLGLAVLVGAVIWLWIASTEARLWRHLERRVEELRHEAEAWHGVRPVLRGSPVPGDAWDDYFKAISVIDGTLDHRAVVRFLNSSSDEERAHAASILSNHWCAVDWIRRGASRREARRARIYESTELEARPPLSQASLLAICRSRLLVEEGDVHDAVGLLLDLHQFGYDVARDGFYVAFALGIAICNGAIAELKDLLLSGRLTTAALEQLDRELEILDSSIPRPSQAVLGRLEHFGNLILNDRLLTYLATIRENPPQSSDLVSWRYAFSARWMQAAAFSHQDALVRRVKEVDRVSWTDERRLWDEARAEANASPNGVTRLISVMECGPGRLARDSLARLRLLRMTVRYRLTGEILDLADPFGEKLRSSQTSRSLRLWSVGLDGVDDQQPDNGPRKADDIVIELTPP
jgi:hypothetical protein